MAEQPHDAPYQMSCHRNNDDVLAHDKRSWQNLQALGLSK